MSILIFFAALLKHIVIDKNDTASSKSYIMPTFKTAMLMNNTSFFNTHVKSKQWKMERVPS